MSYFWASVLHAFLPVTLLLAAHWARRPVGSFKLIFLISCAAMVSGAFLSFYLPKSQLFILRFSCFYVAVILLFLFWQFNRWRDFGVWQFLFVFIASVYWGRTPALLGLSATHVINTELLLNVASVVVAVLLCFVLAWLVCKCIAQVGWLRWPVLIAGAALVVVPLGGQILLSLMKLKVLALTKERLSYVAKTTNLVSEITYAALLLGLLVLVCFAVKVVVARWQMWKGTQPLIERRLANAAYLRARGVSLGMAFVLVAMVAGQLYWDKVASQPLQLTDATRVALDGEDRVRLELAPLMDGRLHRFAWVADDGKLVRFFVINRLEDRVAPAVVFDACLLCGDQGYVQNGEQVECIGCGVYMFKPSIGKPGGCNPVPMEGWEVVDGVIIIPKPTLEEGLMLFSTVVTIDVVDPVTHGRLTNTEASHRYTYKGKTYFFVDEASLNAFREDPEKYIGLELPQEGHVQEDDGRLEGVQQGEGQQSVALQIGLLQGRRS